MLWWTASLLNTPSALLRSLAVLACVSPLPDLRQLQTGKMLRSIRIARPNENSSGLPFTKNTLYDARRLVRTLGLNCTGNALVDALAVIMEVLPLAQMKATAE